MYVKMLCLSINQKSQNLLIIISVKLLNIPGNTTNCSHIAEIKKKKSRQKVSNESNESQSQRNILVGCFLYNPDNVKLIMEC